MPAPPLGVSASVPAIRGVELPAWLSRSEQIAAEIGVWKRVSATRVYGEGRVRAQLAAGRWTALVPQVVVQHNAALSAEQRIWVALFAAPPGTVLHGLSAACRDGLKGFPPETLALVMPKSSYRPLTMLSALPADWNIQLRWSRQLAPRDIHPSGGPPRTRLPRSIIDASADQESERRARVIVLASVQQGLVTSPHLSRVLARRGRCRNSALIKESIADAAGGIQSLPEREFDVLRRTAGLPKPDRQSVLLRPDGRYFLDNDWPTFGIRVEIHGIPHMEVKSWDSDLFRQNTIAITGERLLLYSSYAIRHLGQRVRDQLRRVFLDRGWQPPDCAGSVEVSEPYVARKPPNSDAA